MSDKNDEKETTNGTITEESTAYGDIKINHNVVASIVRIAALEVDGVDAVAGGSFVDNVREIFKPDHAISVSENEGGQYVIEVRLIMRFGVELAKVAMKVQESVREQIKTMTMKDVGQVDVIIDGVRNNEGQMTEIADYQADTIN